MSTQKKQGTRDGFGEAIVALAKEHEDVVALDCDLGRSTRSFRITEVDPSRFIEMGISEQDMISTAAGLASMGKTVFVNSFAVFLTGRAFDQIRQQVSLPAANVKICGSSSGITQGPDGATHQAVLDIALMRSLPNTTVFNPADNRQTVDAVKAAYEIKGPVYIRLSRLATGPVIPEDVPFVPGKAQRILDGKRIALCGSGPITENVLNAASILKADGYEPAVYNFHTVKPLDRGAVEKIAAEYGYVFTVEEHTIVGGFGSAFAEVFSELPSGGRQCNFKRFGVNDCFGESGTAEELVRRHCLDGGSLSEKIRQYIQENDRE